MAYNSIETHVCDVAWLVELINLVSRLVGEATSGDAYNRHRIRFTGVHNIGPVFLLWPLTGEQPPARSTPPISHEFWDYVTGLSSPVSRNKRAVGAPGIFSSRNWAARGSTRFFSSRNWAARGSTRFFHPGTGLLEPRYRIKLVMQRTGFHPPVTRSVVWDECCCHCPHNPLCPSGWPSMHPIWVVTQDLSTNGVTPHHRFPWRNHLCPVTGLLLPVT
jgi:hypothetical protein